MRRIHWLLTGLSLTIILLSLNRLTPMTQGFLQPFEFLRWLDFNAMLPIPILSIVFYYLLKREITIKTPIWLGILLVIGIYLFGAGSGDHEVTNYLNSRYCQNHKLPISACEIIAFNDDGFSHYVYYLGLITMNVSLMLMEFKQPRAKGASNWDLALISLNATVIAAGIFANLAFEETGVDIPVFSAVMVTALYILVSQKSNWKKLPVTYYFAFSYTLGVVGTVVYKFLH